LIQFGQINNGDIVEPGKILFKRTPSEWSLHWCLRYVIIYSNGIKAMVNDTKFGHLKPSGGEIKFIPKDDIKRIYKYKVVILKEPKIPTGFHLEIGKNKICLIHSKANIIGNNYNSILSALKICLGKNWNKVYKNKILIDSEVGILQKKNKTNKRNLNASKLITK
jgi:hypothetical protein